MKKRSKRYKDLEKKKNKGKISIEKAIELIKQTCNTKLKNDSIDLSIRINTKQSKGGEYNLRTVTKLPNGSGKKFSIAVLCEPEKIEEAKSNGANIVGSDDLLEKISSKKINFNKLICTPGMMGKLGKFGKILGPKGLMPNPKLGTVSNNLKGSINDLKNGLTELKNDKDGNLALSIGRKDFSNNKLEENYKFLIDFLKKEKPDTIKGEFIKNIFITSTMGISYKIGGKN
jgi:large subunit ribosomal protein L1|tara:strand:+ start:551 stop:1240 length:690 start_codon:yes stop_codon:yes gene_type:complete